MQSSQDVDLGIDAGDFTQWPDNDFILHLNPIWVTQLIKYVDEPYLRSVKFRNALLLTFHSVLGLAAIVWAAVGQSGDGDNGLTADLVIDLYSSDPDIKLPLQNNAGAMNVPYFVAVAPLISAIHHSLVCNMNSETLRKYIVVGGHYYRWVDYSLSAGHLTIGIAVLCGVRDVLILVGLGGLNIATMVTGLMLEKLNDRSGRLTVWLVGCLMQLFTWAIVLIVFGSALRVSGRVPSFVIVLMVVLLACYTAYGVFAYFEHIGPYRSMQMVPISSIIYSSDEANAPVAIVSLPSEQESKAELARRSKFEKGHDILSVVTKFCCILILFVGSMTRSDSIENP